jgi:adenine-specific DNA-methyltransferase
MQEIDIQEEIRIRYQKDIDSRKQHDERNRLGQFATPKELATEMLTFAKQLTGSEAKIRFLDPAIGTGAFYSAFLNVYDIASVSEAVGFEIDGDYANVANSLWNKYKLRLTLNSFFDAKSPVIEEQRFDLVISNPPYVRNQHINPELKAQLHQLIYKSTGIKLSGLSGLYCYFLLGCHSWMRKGALAGWLIPSEFMDVNYGNKIKDYLLQKVTVLRIHRFDPSEVQFEDALVSSAIIWFRNEPPSANHTVEFTYGGTLLSPRITIKVPIVELKQILKWSKISQKAQKKSAHSPCLKEFFKIKRGIATGANSFFILSEAYAQEINLPREYLQPILPAPRCLNAEKIDGDSNGYPVLENRSCLLSCDLPEARVKTAYPDLWKYLQQGVKEKIAERYICKHRSPWYSQEIRPPAPILFNIIGRVRNGKRKPYRFILNRSFATATNNYLMLYPKGFLKELLEKDPSLLDLVWEVLNNISIAELLANSRVYGGDMHKLEPNELGQVNAEALAKFLSKFQATKQISHYF